jgi:outer membrane protein assembly factor BamB
MKDLLRRYIPLVFLISMLQSFEAPAIFAQAVATIVDPLDWPRWRGPEQNGISRETSIVTQWNPATGDNVLWKRADCGGITTPIVMNGKLYTITRHQRDTAAEAEKVVCLNTATGETVWESVANVYLSDCPAERIGWASCVGDPATGNVYAIGACAQLRCLDGATGKTIWSHSMNEEYGALATYGGRTNVPIVFDNLLIISSVMTGWGDYAVPAHRFIAFDKKDGKPVWITSTGLRPKDTTYSTPFLTTIQGQAAMVVGAADGFVWAMQPRTGKMIWKHQLSIRGINVSPVVDKETVYVGQGEEFIGDNKIGSIVALDASKPGDTTKNGPLWKTDGMEGKSAPLLLNGRVYAGDDGGPIYILDAKTGEEVCRPVKPLGTILRGSPLCAGGKIYYLTTSGYNVFEPTEQGMKSIAKMRMPLDDEVTASPIASHGRLYISTRENLYCVGTKESIASAKADPIPPQPQEAKLLGEQKPTQMQLNPCESLIKPGEKLQLWMRFFDAQGREVKVPAATGKVEYELKGPGKIDGADGSMFTADSANAHTATIITAKWNDLTAQARVRVVPPLPWKFDFENGEIPVTWIGARYRHVVKDSPDSKVMAKITTIPLGTRSQGWFGPNDLHDYTVQADLKGMKIDVKLPDMGLVAQRYTLDIMGQAQQLQIRSWTPQLKRFSKSVPFAWEDGIWYSVKFRASTTGGKATLQGKVWKRDEKEPSGWSIEAVDEFPNLQGSPGIFGNANSSEDPAKGVGIFIDNITVTPN